jgi:hypothetical protein
VSDNPPNRDSYFYDDRVFLDVIRRRYRERAAAFVSVPAQNANAVRSFLEPRPNFLFKRCGRRIKRREIDASLNRKLLARHSNSTVGKRDRAVELCEFRASNVLRVLCVRGSRKSDPMAGSSAGCSG